MKPEFEPRPGELLVDLPVRGDAELYFIGRIHTPWKARRDCPRQGSPDGPLCRVEIFEPWVPGLKGLEAFETLELLY